VGVGVHTCVVVECSHVVDGVRCGRWWILIVCSRGWLGGLYLAVLIIGVVCMYVPSTAKTEL
jgi:hypothetical protein